MITRYKLEVNSENFVKACRAFFIELATRNNFFVLLEQLFYIFQNFFKLFGRISRSVAFKACLIWSEIDV